MVHSKLLLSMAVAMAFLTGCASSQIKARKDQREKAAQSSKLWCEFVNGEVYPDVDVAVNLEMAKRCDADKHFTITSYRTPSENQGVIYCCSVRETVPAAPAATGKADAKKPDGKEEAN